MAFEDEQTVTLTLREANTIITPLQVLGYEGKVDPTSPVAQATEILGAKIARAYS